MKSTSDEQLLEQLTAVAPALTTAEFLAVLTHDLGHSVAELDALVNHLTRHVTMGQQRHLLETAQSAQAASRRVASTVYAMRAFTYGRRDEHEGPTPLKKIVDRVAQDFGRSLGSSGLEIATEMTPDLVLAHGSTVLQQVLALLVLDSVQAARRRSRGFPGAVSIKAKAVDSNIHIGYCEANGEFDDRVDDPFAFPTPMEVARNPYQSSHLPWARELVERVLGGTLVLKDRKPYTVKMIVRNPKVATA